MKYTVTQTPETYRNRLQRFLDNHESLVEFLLSILFGVVGGYILVLAIS